MQYLRILPSNIDYNYDNNNDGVSSDDTISKDLRDKKRTFSKK